MISDEALSYLSSSDPIMAGLIDKYGPLDYGKREDYFQSLVRSVVSQQLSVSAARNIYERLTKLTDLRLDRTLSLTSDEMRSIGLSRQKQAYIKDLASHFSDNNYSPEYFAKLSDDEIISELTQINGIGVWTAQMFMIFTLNRPDVFASNDRGLQIAINNLYGVGGNKPKLKVLDTFATRWAPHRSAACLYLWQSLENK